MIIKTLKFLYMPTKLSKRVPARQNVHPLTKCLLLLVQLIPLPFLSVFSSTSDFPFGILLF